MRESLMKKTLCCLMPVLFLAVILAASGGEFWEKKDYREWSQKECTKLLERSPWSDQFTLTGVTVMDRRSDSSSSDGQQPYIKYQVQFRSALPVRQAIVRQSQIEQKYESLAPEKRQELDKRFEAFMNAYPADAVVVFVTYSTNDRKRDLDLARLWQSKTTDLLKNSVYLIPSKGNRVPLAQFAAAPGAERAITFVFPREVDGKPIVELKDKSIKLEFAYPVVEYMGDGRAFLEFKVEKMIVNGKVEY